MGVPVFRPLSLGRICLKVPVAGSIIVEEAAMVRASEEAIIGAALTWVLVVEVEEGRRAVVG